MIVLGYLVFGDVPGPSTLIGAAPDRRQRPLRALSRARPPRPLTLRSRIIAARLCRLTVRRDRLPKIDVIAAGDLPAKTQSTLAEAFTVHRVEPSARRSRPRSAATARGIARGGHFAIDRAFIESLPKLEIIANFGVGYDGIDLTACARARHRRHQHARRADRGGRRHRARSPADDGARAVRRRAPSARRQMGQRRPLSR